jgi:hypothetical protein
VAILKEIKNTIQNIMIKLKNLLFEKFVYEAPRKELDVDITYTNAKGQQKKIKARDALRLAKDHPAHIQAAKIASTKDAAANQAKSKTEPEKTEKPNKQPEEKPNTGAKPKAAPPPGKLGGTDFKSSAEKNADSEKSQTDKRPGADDMKLKNLMPGIDVSKKTLDQIPPVAKMELSTKIDGLVDMVKQAKAKGEKPEYFNLCKVSVPGTNLYCDGNLGIDRNDMPQFKGDARPGSPADKLPKNKDGEVDGEAFFKQLLQKDGIKVNSGTNDEGVSVPPERLKATQMNMVGDKVAGMYASLEKDPTNPNLTAPIYVSNDGYVLDGHHRWAAIVAYNAKNPDKAIPMKTRIIDEPIKPLVNRANQYADYIGIQKKAAVAGQGNPALKADTGTKGGASPLPEKKKI